MQSDFLKQIPRMAEITLPTSFIDWKSKQINLPTNFRPKNHGNSAGRREWPLLVDEPHYVIIHSDEAKPQHLGTIVLTILSPFYSIHILIIYFLNTVISQSTTILVYLL